MYNFSRRYLIWVGLVGIGFLGFELYTVFYLTKSTKQNNSTVNKVVNLSNTPIKEWFFIKPIFNSQELNYKTKVMLVHNSQLNMYKQELYDKFCTQAGDLEKITIAQAVAIRHSNSKVTTMGPDPRFTRNIICEKRRRYKFGENKEGLIPMEKVGLTKYSI